MAVRLESRKKVLLRVAVWGVLTIGIVFGGGAIAFRSEAWGFLALWLAALHLFWCIGLAMVIEQYRTLPSRTDRGFAGTFHWLIQLYGAVFSGLWFAGLSLMTLVAPVFIVLTASAS